jgi:hypothetical protein
MRLSRMGRIVKPGMQPPRRGIRSGFRTPLGDGFSPDRPPVCGVAFPASQVLGSKIPPPGGFHMQQSAHCFRAVYRMRGVICPAILRSSNVATRPGSDRVSASARRRTCKTPS